MGQVSVDLSSPGAGISGVHADRQQCQGLYSSVEGEYRDGFAI